MLWSGTIILGENTLISNNTSERDGGGIETLGKLIIDGANIKNNTAGTNGGGIDIGNGEFYLITGTVEDNVAGVEGNNIYPDNEILEDKISPKIETSEIPKKWANKDIDIIIKVSDEGTGIKSLTVNDELIANRDGEYEYKIHKEGKYTIVATDYFDNKTTLEFTVEKEYLISEIYKIDHEKKIIYNIPKETTLDKFKANIEASSEYTVKNLEGKEFLDKYIGTGCIISTALGDYTLVVNGDLNGNGETDLNDLAQAQKIYLELLEADSLKKLAIDLNENGQVDLNDLAKLQKIYLVL